MDTAIINHNHKTIWRLRRSLFQGHSRSHSSLVFSVYLAFLHQPNTNAKKQRKKLKREEEGETHSLLSALYRERLWKRSLQGKVSTLFLNPPLWIHIFTRPFSGFFFFFLFFVCPSLAARIFTFRFLLLSSFGACLLWLLLCAVFVLAGVVVEEFGRSVLGFSGDWLPRFLPYWLAAAGLRRWLCCSLLLPAAFWVFMMFWSLGVRGVFGCGFWSFREVAILNRQKLLFLDGCWEKARVFFLVLVHGDGVFSSSCVSVLILCSFAGSKGRFRSARRRHFWGHHLASAMCCLFSA